MKKLRVYLDTSVIGGCFDDEFSEWSNGLFEDFKNNLFKPVISDITASEIEEAPDNVKQKYAGLFEYDVEFINITSEARELAKEYHTYKILNTPFSLH